MELLSFSSELCVKPLWSCCGVRCLSGCELYNRHSKSKTALREQKDVSGRNKEQCSWPCHARWERIGVDTFIYHFLKHTAVQYLSNPDSENIAIAKSHLCYCCQMFWAQSAQTAWQIRINVRCTCIYSLEFKPCTDKSWLCIKQIIKVHTCVLTTSKHTEAAESILDVK